MTSKTAILVHDSGDGCRLECWAGTRKDMAAVVEVCPITPSSTWDGLVAKVREHQAEHACGSAGTAMVEREARISHLEALLTEVINDIEQVVTHGKTGYIDRDMIDDYRERAAIETPATGSRL